MKTESRSVRYQADDRVAAITLNRPRQLNAFDTEMGEALTRCLGRAAADPAIGAVVLTGAGRGFCAGADLEAIDFDRPAGEVLTKHYAPIVERIRDIRKPIIAAVNGPAVGGGASLAIACDVVYAAPSAIFSLAFIRVGLVPDLGATFVLPRRIGPGRAMELALSGRKVGAKEALEIGLVDGVFPDDELIPTALALGLEIAGQPPLAVAAIKDLIQRGSVSTLAEALRAEAEAQDRMGRTDDHREGVVAFLAKRTPRFTGF